MQGLLLLLLLLGTGDPSIKQKIYLTPHLTLVHFFGLEIVPPSDICPRKFRKNKYNIVLHQFWQQLGLKNVSESFI